MNKFIKFLIFPLFILMFASLAYSKEYPKGVKLIKDGNSYIVEYSLPQYMISEIKGGNETFTSLDIPEYGCKRPILVPQIPVLDSRQVHSNLETRCGGGVGVPRSLPSPFQYARVCGQHHRAAGQHTCPAAALPGRGIRHRGVPSRR